MVFVTLDLTDKLNIVAVLLWRKKKMGNFAKKILHQIEAIQPVVRERKSGGGEFTTEVTESTETEKGSRAEARREKRNRRADAGDRKVAEF